MASCAFPFLTRFVDDRRASAVEPAAVASEQQAARRFAALLDLPDDGDRTRGVIALVLARDGRILACNAAGETCFAPDASTGLVGQRLIEALAADSAAVLSAWLESAWVDGRPTPARTWIVERPPRRIALLGSLLPVIENGETVEVLLVGHDVTALHEQELALVRQRDELQQLTDRQSRELAAARDEVAAVCRTRSEVLANMSHELRTPMHAILSFARLGKERAANVPPERLADYFQRILESGDRLLELLGDLLDLARLEAGKAEMDCVRVDLHALCIEVARQFDFMVESKSQTLRICPPKIDATVVGDRRRLGQVVSNLLSNAIKFTPAGGHVTLEFAAAELPAGRRSSDRERQVPAVTLRVADDGVGIAEEDLERIFDKFFQGSRTRTGAGGTGLGLAICREIVDSHRGTIHAVRSPAGGALFEVTLPCLREP